MDLQDLIAKLRTCVHRREPIVTNLPPEIISAIFECSSLLDQICLVLTCKALYHHYQFFLQARGRRLSQTTSTSPRRPVMHRNVVDLQKWPRIQLLYRLEDKRWKYCSGCWNLHRPSAWRHPSGLPLRSSSDFLSLQKPMCMPYAGKIDVCFCLTMTIPDKLHLISTLELSKERDPSSRKYYFDKLFYHPVAGRMRGGLAHDCTITSHPLAVVSVSVTCYWDRYKNTLEIWTRYSFKTRKPFKALETRVHSPHMSLKTPFMCPHKNCKRWLRQFFDEADMNSFGLHKNCRIEILNPCKCFVAKDQFEPYHDFRIDVQRKA